MGAINTTRSKIKNTFRTSSGTEYGTEVALEINESKGQITAKLVVTINLNGKTEKHEFRVEGSST